MRQKPKPARAELERLGDLAAFPGLYVLRSSFSEYWSGERVTVETLHVISTHAGGEVRGYQRVAGSTAWLLRRPAYPPDWPEIDAAVRELTGEPIDLTRSLR